MSRAPGPVGLLFGIALAIVIALLGPLLLFNSAVTSALQVRHGVADAFGTTQAEIDRVTGAFLSDIYLGGPFDAPLDGEEPLLDAGERSHMADVSRLVRLLAGVLIAALVVAFVTGVRLRREPARQGRVMLLAAGMVGVVAIGLALVFALAFDVAFLAFHQLFFRPGTYLFEPGSALITLFPEGFWFDAALLAGAAILLTALVVTAAGAWRLRSAHRSRPQAPATDLL